MKVGFAFVFILILLQTSCINTHYYSHETNIKISQGDSHQVFHPGSVDTIRVVEYSTLHEALAAINSGSADIFGHMIETSNYQILENYPNLKLQWVYDTKLCMIAINTVSYPLENQHLRQAIAYAINKTNIAEEAMNGSVDIVDFLLPLDNEFCIESEEGGEFYNANPTEATKELGMVGFLDVDNDGVVESSNGSEFTLEIIYPFDILGLTETADILSKNLFKQYTHSNGI
jgi:ABC-type transport system substrate-binding protein